MESQFWDVLKTHPILFIAAIVGAVFVISKFLQEGKKLVEMLGFKTPSEVSEHEHDLEEQEHNKQLNEMHDSIRDMREEMRGSFEDFKKTLSKLEQDVSNVKEADVMILGDRIAQRSYHYLDMQGIPADEMPEYRKMYDVYKAIDGNHGIDLLFEKTIEALPVIVKEEVEEDA